MLFSSIAAAFAVGSVSLAATAAEPPARIQPSDPGIKTPAVTYASAFATYDRLPDSGVSPAKFWLEANAKVGAEGMGDSMNMAMPLPTPSTGPSPTAPAKSYSEHGSHGKASGQMSHKMPMPSAKRAATSGLDDQMVQAVKPTETAK